MYERIDISPFLVHFTKGNDTDDAFNNLLSIISNQVIYGTNTYIKGGFNCVCFSEVPIGIIPQGLLNIENYSKYSPFGIILNKDWLFAQGGRPVIYQNEEEYILLSEEIKWRHMTYNPTSKPPIDFTWEREWRIKTTALFINPSVSSIVVPNQEWAERLISFHDESQDMEILKFSMLFNDDLIVEMHRESFQWDIFVLEE